MRRGASRVTVVHRLPSFSQVPDDLLTDHSLSLATRAILAYLVGRPRGWTVYVAQIQRALGISEKLWLAARKEMLARGYFEQWRERGEGGKWEWSNVVYDTPTAPTIPPSGRDGESIPPSGMDGAGMDAQGGDKTIGLDQNNLSSSSTGSAAGHPAGDVAAAPPEIRPTESKRRRVRLSGIVTYYADDHLEAERLEAEATADEIAAAVASVKGTGRQPVPGLVSVQIELGRQRQAAVANQTAAYQHHSRLELDGETLEKGARTMERLGIRGARAAQ